MANEAIIKFDTSRTLTVNCYYDNSGIITKRNAEAIAMTEEPAASGIYKATVPNIAAGDLIEYLDAEYGWVGDEVYEPLQTATLDTIKADTASIKLQTDAMVLTGDREVILTIRDTDSIPLAGVLVWLGVTTNRAVPSVAAHTTNASGQITVWLQDTTYYVFCSLSGYTFADATEDAAVQFTVAAGAVAFTFDIATAVEVASGEATTENFLSRMITSIRNYTDEPALNEKYTDALMVAEIEKAYPPIFNELNRNRNEDPITAKTTLTIVTGTTNYQLPAHVGEIMGQYKEDTESGTKVFYCSQVRYNPLGKIIWLEGNTVCVQPNYFSDGTTITVEYLPTGTARLHYGTCSLNATGTVATFGTNPSLGTLDTHGNAYAGCVLRILSATTNNYIQERTISSYDNTTRAATLSVALDPIPTGTIYYEICPPLNRGLDDVIASFVSYTLLATEGSRQRADSSLTLYRIRMRDLRLGAFYRNHQMSPFLKRDAFNSNKRDYGR